MRAALPAVPGEGGLKLGRFTGREQLDDPDRRQTHMLVDTHEQGMTAVVHLTRAIVVELVEGHQPLYQRAGEPDLAAQRERSPGPRTLRGPNRAVGEVIPPPCLADLRDPLVRRDQV